MLVFRALNGTKSARNLRSLNATIRSLCIDENSMSDELQKTTDGREIVTVNSSDLTPGIYISSPSEKVKEKPLEAYRDYDILYHVPKEDTNRRVRIYQRPRNPSRTGMDSVGRFKIMVERRQSWQDPLTGWYIKDDSFMQDAGLQNLSFATFEEAEKRLKKLGYKNVVHEEMSPSFTGKASSYDDNFLNDYVKTRRSSMESKTFASTQFKHKSRGQTCFVNLKHTPFGVKESKLVSRTQWNDPHPNNHDASEWATNSLRKRQDEIRSKGKH